MRFRLLMRPLVLPAGLRPAGNGEDPPEAVLTGSTPQELGLGRSELLVAQHAGRVQLRQLLQLGRQIDTTGLGRRRNLLRGRRVLLLLHLLELLLLVRLLLRHLLHLRLLVGGGLLPRVLLLLMVVHGARRPNNHGGGGRDARGTD
jgi:hypothetical protein